MENMKRLAVIYSPKVGFGGNNKIWLDIQRYMEKKGMEYDFVQSVGAGSVGRLSKMMCDNGYRTLVIVGNDAALNEALNGILKCETLPEDFALGLIPNGIGNDFARFWGLAEGDYKKAVDRIVVRRLRRIDVGYCVSHDKDNVPLKTYFLNCVNVGLGAKLVDLTVKATEVLRSSRLTTFSVGVANVFERKSFRMSVKVDTEQIDANVMSLCIGNCHGYGQTPNSVPYNRQLDVSLVTRPKWWQLLEGFWLLGKGRFLNYKNVHPYRTQCVELYDVDKAKISVDGCMLESTHLMPMRIGIEPEKLSFIV